MRRPKTDKNNKSEGRSFKPTTHAVRLFNGLLHNNRFILIAICLALLLTACSKQHLEDFGSQFDSFKTYLPTKTGDISYYQLDSILAAPFGVSMDTIHYYAKDSVGDPEITPKDTTYPVYRYLTSTEMNHPWAYQLTYRLVFTEHTAALIDQHNRRFIILTDPVRQDYTWEGNRYFSSDLNPGDFYYDWNYSYDLGQGDDLLTVYQIDQTNGNPGPFDPSLYQETLFAQMAFKKNTGLFSQVVSHVTYQANQNNPNAFGYYEQDSYGAILNRLEQAPRP